MIEIVVAYIIVWLGLAVASTDKVHPRFMPVWHWKNKFLYGCTALWFVLMAHAFLLAYFVKHS